MTFSTPDDFLDHIVGDEVMQKKFAAVNTEAEIQTLLKEVGAAFTAADVRDAFLERFGDQLTDDQLAAVAGGGQRCRHWCRCRYRGGSLRRHGGCRRCRGVGRRVTLNERPIMSRTEAERFITSLADSPGWVARIETLNDNPENVYSLVLSEGFDCTPDEFKDAFLEIHGALLSEEQLAVIAGGLPTYQAIGTGENVELASSVIAATAAI